MSWLLAFLGGGLGALGRYGLALILPRAGEGCPWATLGANLIGSFLIGLIAARVMADETWRVFVVVGLLGGFTTFSAFSYETVGLLQQREIGLAFAYVGASVVLGLGLCWLGMRVSGHA